MKRRRARFGHHAGGPREERYIAKCKACGVVTSGLTSGHNMNLRKSDPKRTGAVYSYELPSGPPYYAYGGDHVIDCRSCGLPRRAQPVRGKYNPGIPCNERCVSSTGTKCECSCGCKNHGGGHSHA